jgi:glycosyltransferase involved in cell wall biosynthesis
VLLIIETHPIQYHAPVWKYLNQVLGIPVTVVYGSDFSVKGYQDKEFGTSFAWDVDLLGGYHSIFLSRSEDGGAKSDSEVTTKGLAEAISMVNPDVILSVGYSPKFHSDAVKTAKKFGKPLMFRAEANDQARVRGPFKRFLRDLFLKRFYRNFHALIHVGKRSEEHYQRLGFQTNSNTFSPYCVDPKPFLADDIYRLALRNEVRKEIGAKDNQIVLLFCGKLSPRKAPELILDAINQMNPADRSKFFVLLVGEGELRRQMEIEANRLNIPLKHVGFKKQHELSQYYHASDLLVLPSIWGETWGLVVNEALHHGVPAVVSSTVGCAEDLIVPGQTGQIFKNGDSQSLAESLNSAVKLVGHPEIRNKCRIKVSGFSVENAAKGIANAIKKVFG